jgi:hypothetical protein
MDLGPLPDSEGGPWIAASDQPAWPARIANWSQRELLKGIEDLTNRYRSEPFDRRPEDRIVLDELWRRLTGRMEQWAEDFEHSPPGTEEVNQLHDFRKDLQGTHRYLELFHQRGSLYSRVDREEWTYVLRPQIRDTLDHYYRPVAVACKSFIKAVSSEQHTDEDTLKFIALVTRFARKMREISDNLRSSGRPRHGY